MKRAMDVLLATIGLILFSPVLAVVFVAVRLRLGRPAIFVQERPGKDGETFSLLKFRTMTNATASDGTLLPDSERLTTFGKFLRRSSLDELPELINVIRGEMSLVGPRPLLLRYSKYFTARESLRLTVRPGITGWAQVNGRNSATWDDRLALDVWYVEHQSLRLDLRILLITLRRVLRSDGVETDPGSAMQNLDDERRSTST